VQWSNGFHRLACCRRAIAAVSIRAAFEEKTTVAGSKGTNPSEVAMTLAMAGALSK
jgi:hypothetical protein